jgi:SAM-dependent methyltransferase
MLSSPVYRKPRYKGPVFIGMEWKVLASILLGAVAIVVGALRWRFTSRQQCAPCPVWLRWFVELDNPLTRTSRAAAIVDHLNLQRGMAILGFGCGPGRVTVPVAKQVGDEGRVVAVDTQAGMLARAKEKAQALKLTNIEFVQAGAGESKLGHCRFNRALLVSVLGEIPDRKGALKEIFDAIKPGVYWPWPKPSLTLTIKCVRP